MLQRGVWRTSSRSSLGDGNCVEVTNLGDTIGVRDSKDRWRWANATEGRSSLLLRHRHIGLADETGDVLPPTWCAHHRLVHHRPGVIFMAELVMHDGTSCGSEPGAHCP